MRIGPRLTERQSAYIESLLAKLGIDELDGLALAGFEDRDELAELDFKEASDVIESLLEQSAAG